MTIPIYGPENLRQAVCFTDVIDPLGLAFGEFSNGRAQQTMSTITEGRPQGGIVTAFDANTGHPVNVPGTRLLLIGSPMDSAGFAGLAGTLADRRGPGGQAQHC